MSGPVCLAWVLEEPRALWGLALALPVLAAHLVRRRRVRIVVPFVALLLEGRGPTRGGGGWRRVAEAAALGCRLAALAALALALARPLAAARPPPVPLAVVVDLDVTLEAREPDGLTRLSHTLARARAEVRAHAEGPVSVVLAGAAPRLLVRDADDREEVVRRLADPGSAGAAERLEAGPGPGDLGAALDVARRLVGPSGRLVVVTARALPAGADPGVEARGAGTADGDQGFVDLRVRASDDGPRTHVEAVVLNVAPRASSRTLRIAVGDAPAEERSLDLPAGAEVVVALDLLVPRGGASASLTLLGADAFARNDRVELVLAPALRPSVLAVAGDEGLRPYTAALLAALGERIDAEASGVVAVRALAGARPRDVTLLDGVPLPAGALVPGAWLFLAPLAGALPFAVGTPVERPLLWNVREGHPLLRDLGLSDAWVARAYPLEPGPGVTGLAFAAADAPVVAEGERDGVRWIAVGLDPEESDLPVRAALPLLVKNALLRLARAPSAPLPPFVRAGGVLRPLAPLPGGPQAQLSWPGGRARARLEPDGEGFPVPPGARGEVEVATGEGATAWKGRTAFVDLDARRSIVPVRPPTALPAPRPDRPPAGQGLQRLLLALAALFLVLDLVAMRTARP